MMNVKCKAAYCWGIVSQNGAFLVSYNFTLKFALQTVDNLVFGSRYTGRYLQLSNAEPTTDGNLVEQQLIQRQLFFVRLQQQANPPLSLGSCIHLWLV
jgi:hypothetical protein